MLTVRAREHTSYLLLPQGNKNYGRVWQEEGSPKSTFQACVGLREDGIAHIHIHRATCGGLRGLHLSFLDTLCKYFFAYDKQKCARLVPLYLAEMDTDPDIHQEFMDGNFAVNKTTDPMMCYRGGSCS